MEGEDYGYYERHPYSATWVYELIGPWILPNNPPVPEGAPPSAGKYDLGGGITARIDPARYEGGKRHIHVQYQGKKYAQNDDGSTSHKSGDPPNSVKKVLKKKLNWDWDGKNSNIVMEYIIWTLVFCQGEGCMLWSQKICL